MARRKIRRLKKWIYVLSIVLVLGIGIFLGIHFDVLSIFSGSKEEPVKKKFTKIEVKAPQDYTVRLFMVGDALIHDSLYRDAKLSDGSYDFKPMLERIKPIASKYDLAYYNQETILGGPELGYSNYPSLILHMKWEMDLLMLDLTWFLLLLIIQWIKVNLVY